MLFALEQRKQDIWDQIFALSMVGKVPSYQNKEITVYNYTEKNTLFCLLPMQQGIWQPTPPPRPSSPR